MAQFDYKNYKPTGVRAVDMVVACIYQQRLSFQPVKTLRLKPRAWHQWVDWMKKQAPEHEHPCNYEFDGVNVELGSLLQVSDISIELYPLIPEIA